MLIFHNSHKIHQQNIFKQHKKNNKKAQVLRITKQNKINDNLPSTKEK